MSLRSSVRVLELRTRDPFTIARGGSDRWRTVFVELDEGGVVGWGEGHPSAYYGENVEETREALEGWLRSCTTVAELLPEAAVASVDGPRAARAALDIALHDFHARRSALSVADWMERQYGLVAGRVPATSYTIGLDEIDVMVEKVEAARNYPILKIKLGTDHDLEIIEAVRAASGAELRIDANAAWSVEETRRKASALERLGVTILEQPLPAEDLEGYRALHGTLPLPVFADESCRRLEDVEKLAGIVDGINIKLSKCGGLATAARMILRARREGLKVMVGCFIESSLAITAAASLGPFVDHLDIDGAALLADDPFKGVEIPSGHVVLPSGPGLGVVTTY